MADTNTFRASAVGLMVAGAKPAKPIRAASARAAGGVRDAADTLSAHGRGRGRRPNERSGGS